MANIAGFGDKLLNMKWLCIFSATLCGAVAAQAHQPPTPPPSGIVVHLFGPGSLATHFLPSGATTPASPNGGGYVEPTTGDILRQMFITGDPNQKPGETLSKGRNGG